MRFLAGESCDFRVVRELRAAGHDVVAVIEAAQGASDAAILEMAVNERRIFLTEDRDFGQLVYAAAKPAPGVILFRFPASTRASLPARVVDIVAKHADKLADRFVVLQPDVSFGGNPRDPPKRYLADGRQRSDDPTSSRRCGYASI
jgi:predicted nuclease of predicted toxin-antitoxin system